MTAAPHEPPTRTAEVAAGRPGDGIVKASWAGTGGFVVTAAVAAAVPAADIVALVVALALFAGGTVAFVAALLQAAGRSRREEPSMAGVFFLDGAPKAVRRLLLGSLALEVVAAFATAGARPNSSLAFGVLVPVWGQGLAGLWGARHNVFAPRPPQPASRVGRSPRAAGPGPAGPDDEAVAAPGDEPAPS